jgi:hypothetical protein
MRCRAPFPATALAAGRGAPHNGGLDPPPGQLPQAPAMSHKHQHLLETIFRDPINTNLHWREVESLMVHLGATVENLSGARLRVKLNGYEDTLRRPHHGSSTLGRQDVKHLREVLARGRVTPSLYAEAMQPKGKGQ